MISKTGPKDFANYFWLNRWMLEFSGILPRFKGEFCLSFMLMALAIICNSFLIIPGAYAVISKSDEIEFTEKIHIITPWLELLVNIFKALTLVSRRSALFSLTQQLSQLWQRVRTVEDRRILEPYVRRSLFLTYGFGANIVLALASIMLSPLLTRFEYDANGTMVVSKVLPYPAGVMHEDGLQFYVWWALQAPAGFVSGVMLVGVDTAAGFYVLHGCAHLKLLQARFRTLLDERQVDSYTGEVKVSRGCVRKMLKEYICMHQEILCYCDMIEHVFKYVILIQMILSITAICVFGFTLLLDFDNLATYVLHVTGASLELLIFCWPPDNLQDEGKQIAFEAYGVRWYEGLKSERSLIKFVIMRSQKPIYLTAGNFAILSLMTFSSVLSSAFSFFSILRKTL